MDFNLDDPLGDLLSEGSNDSFFETAPKKKTSTPLKPSSAKSTTSATSLQPKGKMEDLFGIETTSIAPKRVEPEIKPPISQQPAKVVEPPKLKVTAQKSDGSFNDDDLISDLGFDPKKPKTTSKSNILDDLLGPIERKKSTSSITGRPLTTGGIQKDESKVISRQSTDTTESTVPGTYTASLPRPKTAGRRQSITSVNDPLGFFGTSSTKDKESTESKETPKVKRKGNTADWLGLDSDPKLSQKGPSRPSSPPPPPYQKEPQTQILTIPETPTQANFVLPQTPSASQGAMLFATSTLEMQNALQTMQQQEAQIAVATQVKSQEIALQEMQKRQQELLAQQEAKFNELLQQQLSRQSQLEMKIRSQQERINAHIQLLMAQTAPAPSQTAPKPARRETSEDHGENSEQELDEIQLKAEVKKLELEKLRLEDLLSNITANHEKEIEFMENSHR